VASTTGLANNVVDVEAEDAEMPAPKRSHTELHCFMMTPEQMFQWCTLFVKGMVTACVPFNFVMNTYRA
jgi:hypothetical protein